METLISLERLSPAIADEIDLAVHRLADEIPSDRRRIYARWHGADLWMVIQEDLHPEGRIVLHQQSLSMREGDSSYADVSTVIVMLERRLTVGVYSDAPDKLRCIADMVVHTPQGRYLSHFIKQTDNESSESLFELMQLLLSGDRDSKRVIDRLSVLLRRQWSTIQSTSPAFVEEWELLP